MIGRTGSLNPKFGRSTLDMKSSEFDVSHSRGRSLRTMGYLEDRYFAPANRAKSMAEALLASHKGAKRCQTEFKTA